MKIDAYSHILPAPYFERMRELAVDPGALKRWLELTALHDVGARLRMMEEFGDDYQQILTLSSPPIELLAGPRDSPELARLANESMLELCREHPERFPAFVASLPMNNPDAAMAELAYAIDDLGARGVQVFTNVSGRPLDDPAFRPVFDEMARRDLPIWMHPARGAAFADYATEDASRFEIWWALGWPYETSVAMSRLVFSGLFERHPAIKIITHHMGAMIPYLEGRIGLGWSDQLGSRTEGEVLGEQLPKGLLEYFRRFYADTALSGSAIGMRCGLEFFGPDHVLFATDCPFDPEGGPMYIRETIKAIGSLDLSPEARDRIYHLNISSMIGL
ncbi:amidohydrolase family protein [Nonomuraea endophytica]|uniref:Aminocarboxymuconate-semialdehyde decarboxylase n=1 Tax=Nonomuraea endophytica TaxID=714136 RepID=A0A7W8A403_9ACTN|nr:amidohydrolase family protein [Nonomuraea endophytica]MBB5079186.1 aminocarboxymuconate-semialdehyde decarboxylase [Nonomuraea endophytica]